MAKPKKVGNQLKVVDLTSIGITLVLAIVIGYFAGKWIGGKLGNEMAGSIIGFIVGTAAGFIEMFRAVSRWMEQIEHEEQQNRESRQDEGKGQE